MRASTFSFYSFAGLNEVNLRLILALTICFGRSASGEPTSYAIYGRCHKFFAAVKIRIYTRLQNVKESSTNIIN